MLFAALVETSRRIAATSKRLEKIDLLATLLRGLSPDEAEVATAFLSGNTRQGKIGIGYATLGGMRGNPSEAATLEILELDRTLGEIQAMRGGGSAQRRTEALATLFSRATAP